MNKIKVSTIMALGLVTMVLSVTPSVLGDIVNPTDDVMTSAFFFGTDRVRGYDGDGRDVHRVASNSAFGVGPETIYLLFSADDFSSYGGSVASAVLSMTSTSGGQGFDADAENPFLVSAHAVNLDPVVNISDDTNPNGTISWIEFFNNNILDANSESITTVNSFGIVEFDVSSIVNDWVLGTNDVFAIALTGKNDLQTGNDGNGFLHGFVNNTESPGSSFLTVTASAVPEPVSTFFMVSMLGFTMLRRRRV